MRLIISLHQVGKPVAIVLLFLLLATNLEAQENTEKIFYWDSSDRVRIHKDLFTRSTVQTTLQIPIPGVQPVYEIHKNPYIKFLHDSAITGYQSFSGRDSLGQPVFGYIHEDGIHLSYYKNGEVVTILPKKDEPDIYVMTSAKDLESRGDFLCEAEGLSPLKVRRGGNSVACQSQNYGSLTFDLFVVCTGEWGSYYKSISSSRQSIANHVTSLNAFYSGEMNISFNLITDNQYLYTNSATDYFNPGNGNLANQARTFFKTFVNSPFDLGHVFHRINSGGTSAAGAAYVGVSCNDEYKGGAYTSTSAPNNISFNLQVFAHEIGHQLGAEHTFYGSEGNCSQSQRSDGDGFEPGSGSSIMSYEGQCGGHNLDGPRSQTMYFNTHSLSQILNRINSQSSCGFRSGRGNNLSVDIPRDFSIPKRTAFDLIATGGNAAFSYNWEQYDTDNSGGSNTRSDPINGGNYSSTPMYRSYDPSSEGHHRSFPSKNVQNSGTTNRGEVYATVARDITMRLTTRSGGTIGCKEMTVTVRNASPFKIEQPLQNEIVELNENPAGSSADMTVKWETGDTENNGFSTVDILYSTDGGQSFPHLLADNVINDGEHEVRPPKITTSNARLKILLTDGSGQMAIYHQNRGNFTVSFATLPIEIAEFTGKLTDDHHTLSWTLNNTGEHITAVNLEYSYDGITYKSTALPNFESLNSQSQWEDKYQSYFTHAATTYYRLSVENIQGEKTLSAVVALKNEDTENELLTLHPNPVNNQEVQLQFRNYLKPHARIKIWSLKGQRMYETIIAARTRSMILPVHWPEGMYIIELQNGTDRYHKKLIVQ